MKYLQIKNMKSIKKKKKNTSEKTQINNNN